jgi:hypothetical protein
MGTRYLLWLILPIALPGFAEVRFNDKIAHSGLKGIEVTHWSTRSSEPGSNPYVESVVGVTLTLEKDSKPILVTPLAWILNKEKKNEITARASISEDQLPNIVVSVWGLGASANADGYFCHQYRYVPAKKSFELVQLKPPDKLNVGDGK